MAQRQAYHVRRHEIGSFHFSPLANIKVLAVRTKPITASRGDREYFRSGHVVDYGLFLDRVNMSSDHFSIDEKLEFSADVLSDPAEANLSLGNVAVSSACCASDP
jgi:hypothetical protein